ncbi:RICIN domain-containing protein [Streptosporangium sp. NPDC048865]|uniref:RICIN domain-containing protein n=1 Tax=Streptosporangium sp. NPDC048865 TaxID=3155766 RepID=UPI00343C4844
MTEIIRIRNAPGAAETIGAIIATSFHEQEVSAWMIPPDDDRRRVMPPFFSMLTEGALLHGEVHAMADMSAVAVWFRKGAEPLPEVPDRAPNYSTANGVRLQIWSCNGAANQRWTRV